MKRFLILFLIFIFSIGVVSAEDADLIEDDFIPVNMDSETYSMSIPHYDVSVDVSSNVSGFADNKALIDVNVNCEDNSSFNHFLEVYPNEDSSPILVNIHDGLGSFFLPIDNSTSYFNVVFDNSKFDAPYKYASTNQNCTVSNAAQVAYCDVDLSWDLIRFGPLYEITLNIKNNGPCDLENVSLYFYNSMPLFFFNYSFFYAGYDWNFTNQSFLFNGTFKANQSTILKIRSEFLTSSYFDVILETGNCSIASASGTFDYSPEVESPVDITNASAYILPGGIVVDNKWGDVNVPNFNDPDELYDLLIKSNNEEMCLIYLRQFSQMDNDSHMYAEHINRIWDAIRYIQQEPANWESYVDPSYYPDSSDPCLRNHMTLPTIASHDLVKYYKDDNQFEAMILGVNSSNSTKDASFIINGRTYNRSIDENRISRISINLGPGVYNITTVNPFNGERKTNTITVLSLIESNNLVKYYRNDSQFIVKVFNKTSGNVTFNINGVFYIRMINESGYAKLNINLNPGEYIVTTDYNGCKEANNVTVLSILSADDLEMKYRDGSKFTVKVMDAQGMALANAAVTFNVNGVFYKRISDANGEAKLNINLMAGKYIITSTYNTLNVSNKITISA
jgi:hypothetical protein